MASLNPREAAPDGGELAGIGEAEAPLFVDINITPLVDVVLVLLIVFMVGSSAMLDAARGTGEAGARLELNLPSAAAATLPAPEAPVLLLSVSADGGVHQGSEALDRAALAALLAQTQADAPATAVIVDADGAVPHRRVVEILDAVQRAGLSHVGIGAQTLQP